MQEVGDVARIGKETNNKRSNDASNYLPSLPFPQLKNPDLVVLPPPATPPLSPLPLPSAPAVASSMLALLPTAGLALGEEVSLAGLDDDPKPGAVQFEVEVDPNGRKG